MGFNSDFKGLKVKVKFTSTIAFADTEVRQIITPTRSQPRRWTGLGVELHFAASLPLGNTRSPIVQEAF